jgi:hypothetical protein
VRSRRPALLLLLLLELVPVRVQGLEELVDEPRREDLPIPPDLDDPPDLLDEGHVPLADVLERLRKDRAHALQKVPAAVPLAVLQHLVGHVQQRQQLLPPGDLQGVPPLVDGDDRLVVVLHHGRRGSLDRLGTRVEPGEGLAQPVHDGD